MSAILMTGCCSGLGAYVRERLLEQTHLVYGVGIGGPDLKVDLCSLTEKQADEMFADAEQKLGHKISILINNAGMTKIDFLEWHAPEDFRMVMDLNLYTPFLLTKAWFRRYRHEQPIVDYRVVHTTSMAAQVALRGSPAYCASKAGLEAFSAVCAKEWAGKYPFSSFCVAPCTIDDTVMSNEVIDALMRTRGMSREQAVAYSLQSPFGRAATKQEVWELFDFTVNKAPLTMSGTVLRMPAATGNIV